MASNSNNDAGASSMEQGKATDQQRFPSELDSLLGSTVGGDEPDSHDDEEEGQHGSRHFRNISDMSFLGTIVEGVEFFAEQAQEAASDFKDAWVEGVETAQEVALDIKDAIVEEAQDVKETLVDDLVDKDDGESVIFEMGLTRNLSILPSDIEEVAGIQHHNHRDDDDEDAQTILPEVMDTFNCCPEKIRSCCQPNQSTLMDSPPKPGKKIGDVKTGEETPLVEKRQSIAISRVPFHAYITLLGAVVCLSSIGPSLDLQSGVESSMKIYWRMSGTYMVLSPLAAKAVWKEGLPSLTSTQWCTFLLAALCYATMCVCFVLALDFTSVGNAVIFSNSQSLLLLMGKALVGQAVSLMEGSGALVAFSGAVLCACDSSASTGNVFSTSGPVVWAGWGDLLALLSAIGGVGYLVFAKSLRQHVTSVFLFMFMIMFGGSFCVLTFLWVSGVEFTFDRDLHHGLWGFMNFQLDRLPLEIWMVCVCNLMGAMGYVRAMAYFDNLIISVATLMEPVVASFMAYALKVGLLPNTIGWIGNFLVAAGTIAVIYPSSQGKSAAGGH